MNRQPTKIQVGKQTECLKRGAGRGAKDGLTKSSNTAQVKNLLSKSTQKLCVKATRMYTLTPSHEWAGSGRKAKKRPYLYMTGYLVSRALGCL